MPENEDTAIRTSEFILRSIVNHAQVLHEEGITIRPFDALKEEVGEETLLKYARVDFMVGHVMYFVLKPPFFVSSFPELLRV